MKPIDADKLIAEIERLKRVEYGEGYEYDDIGTYALDEVLSLITSLQQEQTEVDLEKAARNVYESWMGGTMDDVRRDMVALGTVLNAGKEE